MVNRVANYIIYSGGKRLRPLLVLLAARACGHSGIRHIDAAAIIEFIHTATLLHDDVVDGSSLRRGRKTANEEFGNAPSVLVGDFLYSRAFQMMVKLDRMRIMDIMADATNAIAEGEVLQLMNARDPNTSEARYLDVINRKTARLFQAGAQIGAVLTIPRPYRGVAREVRQHIGTAFQLVDDALDYQADEASLGKHLGDDLAEGKPTLPLIYAMQHGNDTHRAMIRAAIEEGGSGTPGDHPRRCKPRGPCVHCATRPKRGRSGACRAGPPSRIGIQRRFERTRQVRRGPQALSSRPISGCSSAW